MTDTQGNETQTTAANIHVNTATSSLAGKGWTTADIGDPYIKGSGSMTNDVLTVKGNGKLGKSEGGTERSEANNATKDDFHFVYKEMNGDMEFTAKLEEIVPLTTMPSPG